MIYLLYGSDTYRSRQKLREIIAAYKAKFGSAANIHRVDVEDEPFPLAADALKAVSLFSSAKKLVVLEYIFSDVERLKLLLKLLGRTRETSDTIAILWHGAIDKKIMPLLGAVEKIAAKTQEFPELDGRALAQWINAEAGRRGIALGVAEHSAIAALAPDTWKIAQELDKIAMGATPENTALVSSGDNAIFALGDIFFTDSRRAYRLLHALLGAGEDPHQIFAYLAGQTRAIVAAGAAQKTRLPIPKEAGIHPFVAKKAGVVAQRMAIGTSERTHADFLDEDYKIKIGLTTADEAIERILLRGRTNRTDALRRA